MRIQKIKVQNILGIESLELEPKAFTQISGRNGTGKSSFIEALKAALGGGHDASLLRAGAEQGEVALVLDDGHEIRKTITPEKSEVTVRDRDRVKLSRTAAWLKERVDGLVNPVDLIEAAPKDRVTLFLEAMPMELSLAEMEREIGPCFGQVKAKVAYYGHALERVEFARKDIFERREGVNREAKKLRSHVEGLERDLPPAEEDATDWQGKQAHIEAERQFLREHLVLDLNAARDRQVADDRKDGEAFFAIRDREKEAAAAAIRELERELASKVRMIEAERDSRIEQARKEHEHNALAGRQRREEAEQKAKGEHDPEILSLTTKIEEAKARAGTQAFVKGQRANLEKSLREAERLEKSSSEMTEALGRIDALKARLVSSLPIQGLAVRDGEIFAADGAGEIRPWDRLNKAQQIRIALEVAKLRAKDLKLILVDNFEHLDPASREEFKRQVLESAGDYEYFVTVVSDAEALQVETVAAGGAA